MAHIIKEKTICNKCNRRCDDIYGNAENVFFVMDGATPLFDDNVFSSVSDVYDFMHALQNSLVEQILVNASAPLAKLLRIAIEIACEKLSVPDDMLESEGPNYTVAMIRVNECDIDYYICADASIIMEVDEGIEILTDERFTPFEAENTRRIALLGDKENKEALKKEIYRDTRHKANQPGGYLVTSINPNSAANGLVGKLPKNSEKRILLCSDGYTKQEYLYQNLDLNHVEQHEQALLTLPAHDDITYMLIEL